MFDILLENLEKCFFFSLLKIRAFSPEKKFPFKLKQACFERGKTHHFFGDTFRSQCIYCAHQASEEHVIPTLRKQF